MKLLSSLFSDYMFHENLQAQQSFKNTLLLFNLRCLIMTDFALLCRSVITDMFELTVPPHSHIVNLWKFGAHGKFKQWY